LAAIAALIAVIAEGRRRKDDRRKQALLIAAWTEVDDSMVNPETGDGVRCIAHAANRNDLPVTNVIVYRAAHGPYARDRMPLVWRIHGLGPGQEVTRHVAETDAHDAHGYPKEVIAIEFVYQANRRWVRNDSGLNEEIFQKN
jgi:methyl coenzyme M reductase gamma subunit